MEDRDKSFEKQLDRLASSTRSPRGQFSAGATRPLLEKRIAARHRRRFLRIASSVAAVMLLGVISWNTYIYITSVETLTVATLAETQTVRLPDGTQVVLNHHSSLSYPHRFQKNMREVTLRGEACFAVSKNAAHPFVVHAGAVNVRVLGTEFNIEAYPNDEQITTTLFEGSVAIETDDRRSLVLAPGEQVVYNQISKSLNKSLPARPADEIAWQSGAVIFNNQPLGDIARRLSNLFDVTIRIPDPALAASRMSARFIHGESLDSMLLLFEEVGGFTVTKNNDTIHFIHNN